MDKRDIKAIFPLIAIFVLPPAMILIYNLEYYANALSSVVIATATVIYATLTYLLLLEQQREKKKQRIQEISDFVICPLVKRLESQKSYLEKGDFGYDDKEVRYVTEFTATFWGIKKLIYDDFKVVDSKVGDKIEEHDKEVEKLKDSLKEFADEIKSLQDFRNTVSERFEEYRKSEKIEKASLFEPTDKNFGYISELIVNNKQELKERYAYHKFWSLYGKEFLGFRDKEEMKIYTAEVERKRKILLGFEDCILKDLMGILKIYRKKYEITYRWMKEAEDMEIEEKLGLT